MPRSLDTTFQESLKVATFLGGFTIGILTFLITFDMPYETVKFIDHQMNIILYKEILITFTGITAASLILSIFGIKIAIVHQLFFSMFSRFSLFLYEFGLIGILALVILLVISITDIGAIIIIGMVGAWFGVFSVNYLKNHHKEHEAVTSDIIEINATLTNNFQRVNLTCGNGIEKYSNNNYHYEFEKLSFNKCIEETNSKHLSGILKIEEKDNSEDDSIYYNHYKLVGDFNLVNSKENVKNGEKSLFYKGDLIITKDSKTSDSLVSSYKSEITIRQPQNDIKITGKKYKINYY